MAYIQLTTDTTHIRLMQALHEAGCLEGEWEKLVVQVPDDHTFVTSAAIAELCSWGMGQIINDRKIQFLGRRSTLNYLSRMDLFRHLKFDYDERFQRHSEVGRFIPIQLVDDDRAVQRSVNAICDLVLHTFPNAREFLPAMEWAVCEIVDNVHIHSETPVPGVMCAQFFPSRQRLDIAVCDMGRGIKRSLEESYVLHSHGDAISQAIKRGVTRNPEIGQGNGLAGAVEIVHCNQGDFHLWSGDVNYRSLSDRPGGFEQIPVLPGTGVFLRLNTQTPVDLGQTFIGSSDWNYLDVVRERIQDAGGILVKEACSTTGRRQPAKALRLKILSILPDLDAPLVLDFDGIEMASSSFLDELLGRLASELGIDKFKRRIQTINASDLILKMANTVIHQRMEKAHS